MERDAHDSGRLRPFPVHELETIDHVTGKVVRGAESAVLVEPVVVRFERV